MNNNQSGNEKQSQPEAQNRSNDEQSANDNQTPDRSNDDNNSNNQSGTDNQASSSEGPNTSGSPAGSRPPSQASNNNKSRPASQASDRPQSQASNNNNSKSRPASQASNRPQSQASNNNNNSKSRPASQASNRPQSQASNKPKPSQSRKSSSSPSISRPRQSPRGRSRTPRSISAASQDGSDEDRDGAVTPTDNNAGTFADQEDLPDVDEEEGEGDNAIETTAKGKDDGEKKAKRRRRGKKKSFGVNAWPHGDNPGPMEPPHGVNDWPYEEDSEGVGTSGKVLQRPKGVRDFSPAYAPSDAGSNASTGTDYSAVSGLSLGDWERDSLPGVDSWPYGDNPGIMVKPLDHWGQPLKNPDGTLMQKENPTGLPDYEELKGMDLDSRDDHIIALKLEIDLDVAVEINARIHGDITLALLM